jgi:D-beta-D-heptose 7-phosphate kinase/D-beta-D-heptose 1-phosphate adenosyltransferase
MTDAQPDKGRLLEALDRFAGTRVMVLGDLMLDRFIWGKVSRISPEAPVPVVLVDRDSIMLGGAANVANNLRAMGAEPFLVGAVGDDEAAGEFRAELAGKGINAGGVVGDPFRPTIQKTRVVAHSQQVVRVDRETPGDLGGSTEKALMDVIEAHGDSMGAMIISDYAKGAVTRALMDALAGKSIDKGIPLIVDPKKKDLSFYQGCTYITPNVNEAAQSSGVDIIDADSLELAGRKIMADLSCEGILVTQGEGGMTLLPMEGEPYHVASQAREVYDVTGAGDTVISTFSLGLAVGLPVREAVFLANAAAGLAVEKVGTAIVTVDELREAIEKNDLSG